MKRRLIFVGTLAATLCVGIQPALGQTVCAPRDTVKDRLLDKYDEILVGGGTFAESENKAEFYISPENRTWTFLIIYPDGQACLMAAGSSWEIGSGYPENEVPS